MKSPKHVFISYPHANIEQAMLIRQRLEQAGHVVWQDTTDIQAGDDWADSLRDAVSRAYVVVALVSVHWNESYWARIEVKYALDHEILLIPVLVDETEVPFELLNLHAIFLAEGYEHGMRRLVEVLAQARPVERPVTEQTQPLPLLRQLELQYLENLLLKYSLWAEKYTPMLAFGQLRLTDEGASDLPLRVKPSTIAPSFVRDFDLSEESVATFAIQQKAYDGILPAVTEMRQLVLLGDPGSGKTTSLWFLVQHFAQEATHDPMRPLPVLLRLSKLEAKQQVEQFIVHELGHLGPEYRRLLSERRLALLLDGINELPQADRAITLEQIKALVRECLNQSLVIVATCRELDYTNDFDLHLPNRLKIAPLDPLRIRRFLRSYFVPPSAGDVLFWQLAGEQAARNWREFREQVSDDEQSFWTGSLLSDQQEWGVANTKWEAWVRERQRSKSLLTLASNPYMLYMMTKIFERAQHIPQNRSRIFRHFVDHLLLEREHMDTVAADQLIHDLGILALDTMRTIGSGTAFDKNMVLEHLQGAAQLHQAWSASILSASGESVRFAHQLLQEYFAANALAEAIDRDGEALSFLLTLDGSGDYTMWDETLIFLGGLYPEERGGVNQILELVMPSQPILACRIATESGNRHAIGQDTRERLIRRCRAVMQSPTQPVLHRYHVAVELGHLDLALPLERNHLIPIPGGMFFYVPGQHHVASFFIASYPVTNRQFRAFISERGYSNAAFWSSQWEWLQTHVPERQPFFYQRGRPELIQADAPVVGISWHEAEAFCRWKNQTLNQELKKDGWEIRLPTLSEWLVAVRGREGRTYPWGNERTKLRDRCQFQASGLPGPAPVGIYPLGESPESISELVGNIFEFVSAGGDDYLRHCRGGSWLESADLLDPDADELIAVDERTRSDVGFRYVFAPTIRASQS